MMGFLVVLLTVLGLCAFVAAGLAFERRFGGALDDWLGAPPRLPKARPAPAPAPRRWTEAQLFEPVSKWVEDAERAVVAAEQTRGAPHFEDGHLVVGPRFELSADEYVIRAGDGRVVRRYPWRDPCSS